MFTFGSAYHFKVLSYHVFDWQGKLGVAEGGRLLPHTHPIWAAVGVDLELEGDGVCIIPRQAMKGTHQEVSVFADIKHNKAAQTFVLSGLGEQIELN